MVIPTEPIGSVPRSSELLAAMTRHSVGAISNAELGRAQDLTLRDTVAEFDAKRSPMIADGEQTKLRFATYPVAGLKLAADGVVIPFADDTSMSRETAFQEIRRRVGGTALEARALGV